MQGLLTAAAMRAVERAATDGGRASGLALMERAGRGVVEAVLERWPALARAPGRALVLCGPGNNGGDGFVVARLLKERGWEVDLLLRGDEAKLPPDAASNARRWRALGAVGAFDDAVAAGRVAGADLVVDALFGTGLSRPVAGIGLTGRATGAAAAEPGPPHVVAVDMPTGLCGDSGRPIGRPDAGQISAHLTVTFHRARPGHYLADGPERCGSLRVADIGLTDEGPPNPPGAGLVGPDGWAARLAKRGGHKYDHGHALVLSGGVGRGGAARLAARAALRVGAGAVTLGAPPAAVIENAGRLDAIMLRPVPDLAAFLAEADAAKMNAVCLGPGMGRGGATRAAVAAACASGRAVVLDADALTAFEDDAPALFALLHGRCVLTPHPGEFARVFPDLAARLSETAGAGPAFSKLDAARAAAARAGAVVLLKGPDTAISGPDGRAAIAAAAYGRAAPWLATAGAGDVLAGLIAGLLARGMAPFDAAACAAWLHVEAARAFGPGLVAEDLPEALPAVFRAIGV